MEFKGQLGIYKIVTTEDNTQTVWSEYFNEACHNLSGAYAETLHNYIQGCELLAQVKNSQELHILDVGFGVGIGLKAFLDFHQEQSYHTRPCSYTSIELDEEFFLWSVKNTVPDLVLKRYEENQTVSYQGDHQNIKITVFIGDGRLTLPRNQEKLPHFTAIFQDAFSPKKNPALWSVEWFTFLKSVSAPSVQLATYSSSISIRKSLLKAGWSIESKKGFGQKRTMTKANLLGQTASELLEELKKSPILEIVDN